MTWSRNSVCIMLECRPGYRLRVRGRAPGWSEPSGARRGGQFCAGAAGSLSALERKRNHSCSADAEPFLMPQSESAGRGSCKGALRRHPVPVVFVIAASCCDSHDNADKDRDTDRGRCTDTRFGSASGRSWWFRWIDHGRVSKRGEADHYCEENCFELHVDLRGGVDNSECRFWRQRCYFIDAQCCMLRALVDATCNTAICLGVLVGFLKIRGGLLRHD